MGGGSKIFSKFKKEKALSQKRGNKKDGISKWRKRVKVYLENLEIYSPI